MQHDRSIQLSLCVTLGDYIWLFHSAITPGRYSRPYNQQLHLVVKSGWYTRPLLSAVTQVITRNRHRRPFNAAVSLGRGTRSLHAAVTLD